MRILLSTCSLVNRAGSETYLLCLGSELQRLGHQVFLHSVEDAEHSTLAHEHGLRFAAGDDELPDQPEVIVAQDAVASYTLAARFPRVPQLYVAHSPLHDFQIPPQLPDVIGGLVALNGRMAQWLEALGTRPEIVRLRQPVRIEYFASLRALPAHPERLLSLGNRMTPERRVDLLDACKALDIQYEEVGLQAGRNIDPSVAIADADIVVGYGRCVIEAMAAGRAVYVYDHAGGDGWVTPSTWERLEASGFNGRSGLEPIDRDRLLHDLGNYTPKMGADNRELARRYHNVLPHAEAVVGLLTRLTPSAAGPTEAEEMGRLVRLARDHEQDAFRKARRIHVLEKRLEEDGQRAGELARERRQSQRLRAKLGEIRSSRVYRALAAARRVAGRRP